MHAGIHSIIIKIDKNSNDTCNLYFCIIIIIRKIET